VPGLPNADNSTDWMIQARSRLARRRAEKPATKASQIRALWPDIEAALSVGQSMKTICAWLAEDAGITLGVTSLTSYVSRIRRREAASRHTTVRSPAALDLTAADRFPTLTPLHAVALRSQSAGTSGSDPASKFDPLANYRARQGKDSGFNYLPATVEDEKDLI
jgi:hypothetical protein